jgi:hypothetical protein
MPRGRASEASLADHEERRFYTDPEADPEVDAAFSSATVGTGRPANPHKTTNAGSTIVFRPITSNSWPSNLERTASAHAFRWRPDFTDRPQARIVPANRCDVLFIFVRSGESI